MLLNTNLSTAATTLTRWLVSIPSVSQNKGTSVITQSIYEGLGEFPYFKQHPEHLILVPHADGAKSSVVSLVKALDNIEDTLVLLCDVDTNSPAHYGILKNISTQSDELERQLLKLVGDNQTLKQKLEQHEALFGLGVLESKCATGCMLAALKELSDNHVRQNLNILLICTCDNAHQHQGLKQCIKVVQDLCEKEKLSLRLTLNAQPQLNNPTFANSAALFNVAANTVVPRDNTAEKQDAEESILNSDSTLNNAKNQDNANALASLGATLQEQSSDASQDTAKSQTKEKQGLLNQNLARQALTRGVPELCLYTGNYGKIEPSFYILGQSSSVNQPFTGFSASLIAAELIREFELNPRILQKLHQKPLIPTFDSLKVKDFGKEFSPDGVQLSFNLPILPAIDLSDVLELMKEIAAKAIESAAEVVDEREAILAKINQQPFVPQSQDAEVISFSDLLERACLNYTGNMRKAISSLIKKCKKEGYNSHQSAIFIIERLNDFAQLPRPSIVVYFTDNFVPSQSLNAINYQDRELFMLLDNLMHSFARTTSINAHMSTHYAPTEAGFLRPEGLDKTSKILDVESPLGFDRLPSLNVPTVTLGVLGGNLSHVTEYVEGSMCHYLPAFVMQLVDTLANNPLSQSDALHPHDDLQLHLEELGQRAEEIAAAALNEIRAVDQQSKEGTGFYSQVSQGTLSPESLSYKDFQKKLRQDAKLSENVSAHAEQGSTNAKLANADTQALAKQDASAESAQALEQDSQTHEATTQVKPQDELISASANLEQAQDATNSQAVSLADKQQAPYQALATSLSESGTTTTEQTKLQTDVAKQASSLEQSGSVEQLASEKSASPIEQVAHENSTSPVEQGDLINHTSSDKAYEPTSGESAKEQASIALDDTKQAQAITSEQGDVHNLATSDTEGKVTEQNVAQASGQAIAQITGQAIDASIVSDSLAEAAHLHTQVQDGTAVQQLKSQDSPLEASHALQNTSAQQSELKQQDSVVPATLKQDSNKLQHSLHSLSGTMGVQSGIQPDKPSASADQFLLQNAPEHVDVHNIAPQLKHELNDVQMQPEAIPQLTQVTPAVSTVPEGQIIDQAQQKIKSAFGSFKKFISDNIKPKPNKTVKDKSIEPELKMPSGVDKSATPDIDQALAAASAIASAVNDTKHPEQEHMHVGIFTAKDGEELAQHHNVGKLIADTEVVDPSVSLEQKAHKQYSSKEESVLHDTAASAIAGLKNLKLSSFGSLLGLNRNKAEHNKQNTTQPAQGQQDDGVKTNAQHAVSASQDGQAMFEAQLGQGLKVHSLASENLNSSLQAQSQATAKLDLSLSTQAPESGLTVAQVSEENLTVAQAFAPTAQDIPTQVGSSVGPHLLNMQAGTLSLSAENAVLTTASATENQHQQADIVASSQPQDSLAAQQAVLSSVQQEVDATKSHSQEPALATSANLGTEGTVASENQATASNVATDSVLTEHQADAASKLATSPDSLVADSSKEATLGSAQVSTENNAQVATESNAQIATANNAQASAENNSQLKSPDNATTQPDSAKEATNLEPKQDKAVTQAESQTATVQEQAVPDGSISTQTQETNAEQGHDGHELHTTVAHMANTTIVYTLDEHNEPKPESESSALHYDESESANGNTHIMQATSALNKEPPVVQPNQDTIISGHEVSPKVQVSNVANTVITHTTQGFVSTRGEELPPLPGESRKTPMSTLVSTEPKPITVSKVIYTSEQATLYYPSMGNKTQVTSDDSKQHAAQAPSKPQGSVNNQAQAQANATQGQVSTAAQASDSLATTASDLASTQDLGKGQDVAKVASSSKVLNPEQDEQRAASEDKSKLHSQSPSAMAQQAKLEQKHESNTPKLKDESPIVKSTAQDEASDLSTSTLSGAFSVSYENAQEQNAKSASLVGAEVKASVPSEAKPSAKLDASLPDATLTTTNTKQENKSSTSIKLEPKDALSATATEQGINQPSLDAEAMLQNATPLKSEASENDAVKGMLFNNMGTDFSSNYANTSLEGLALEKMDPAQAFAQLLGEIEEDDSAKNNFRNDDSAAQLEKAASAKLAPEYSNVDSTPSQEQMSDTSAMVKPSTNAIADSSASAKDSTASLDLAESQAQVRTPKSTAQLETAQANQDGLEPSLPEPAVANAELNAAYSVEQADIAEAMVENLAPAPKAAKAKNPTRVARAKSAASEAIPQGMNNLPAQSMDMMPSAPKSSPRKVYVPKDSNFYGDLEQPQTPVVTRSLAPNVTGGSATLRTLKSMPTATVKPSPAKIRSSQLAARRGGVAGVPGLAGAAGVLGTGDGRSTLSDLNQDLTSLDAPTNQNRPTRRGGQAIGGLNRPGLSTGSNYGPMASAITSTLIESRPTGAKNAFNGVETAISTSLRTNAMQAKANQEMVSAQPTRSNKGGLGPGVTQRRQMLKPDAGGNTRDYISLTTAMSAARLRNTKVRTPLKLNESAQNPNDPQTLKERRAALHKAMYGGLDEEVAVVNPVLGLGNKQSSAANMASEPNVARMESAIGENVAKAVEGDNLAEGEDKPTTKSAGRKPKGSFIAFDKGDFLNYDPTALTASFSSARNEMGANKVRKVPKAPK